MKNYALQTQPHTPNYSLDFIKGFCIILVVLCHCVGLYEVPFGLGYFFSSIFLGSFYMVSGWIIYFQGDMSASERIKRISRRFNSLIIPYLVFSILAIIWHLFICVICGNTYVSDTYTEWKVVERDVFCMFSGLGIGTLWFLPVLFISFSIFQLIHICISRLDSKVRLFILLFIAAALIVLSSVISGIHYDSTNMIGKIADEYMNMLYRIIYGIGYIIIGYLLHFIWDYLMHKNKLTITISIVLSLACVSITLLIIDPECAL